MKKRMMVWAMLLGVLLSFSGCSGSVPIIGDFIKSENSLGKTNNTAVTISAAMKAFLKGKNKGHYSLYGMEMILNSDGNGAIKLFYTGETPENADYSDVYVAEVDSKTGHVERFEKADYAKDGLAPYQCVREGYAFDGASLPIDSGKAIANGVKSFSSDADFHYDYVQMQLKSDGQTEQYTVRFISMLNDMIYHCNIDAVSGNVLKASVAPLE